MKNNSRKQAFTARRLLTSAVAVVLPIAIVVGSFQLYVSYHVRHAIQATNSLNPIESLVNDTRSSYGNPNLIHSDALESMAYSRCQEIQSDNDFSHSGFYVVSKAQSAFSKMGENLAKNYPSDKDLVNAWIASPEHFQNMVGDWKYTAAVRCGKYVVQLFGTYP